MLVGTPTTLGAQRLQPELRADVLGPQPYSVQSGIGLVATMGLYVRTSVDVGYAPKADSRMIADHLRADLITRVTLDPFREERWAVAFGGGLSVRHRTFLLAIAELEGPVIPVMHGLVPAVQMGVSGGVRVALIVRRPVAGRR